MQNKSIKVLGFQLKVELDCNNIDEYLIENKLLNDQMQRVKEIIKEKDADIIMFPEMCYLINLEDYYKELSKNRLVIAGSIYEKGINYTVIFQNQEKHLVKKYNASVAEPMIRKQVECSTKEFMKKYLKEHIFQIKGKKVVILNCMEYYQHAYTIGRETPNLFAILCICSNNNQKVFLDETKALHNHCDNIYSFVLNCVSTYMGKEFAKGESYIFGPIQKYEQDFLKKENVKQYDHCCSILTLSKEPEYFYGEFLSNFSKYGRSDKYTNNPKNIEISKII